MVTDLERLSIENARLIELLEHHGDVVRVSREGIVTSAVDLLVDQGFNRRDLDWIIPLRRLTHCREKGQKQTTDETERWLRAAKRSRIHPRHR